MAAVAQFLTVDQFQSMFARTLDATERALATPLLQAAAIWIQDPSRCGELTADNINAQLVSYEVTRDVLLPGQHRGQTQYSRQAGDRLTSFSLAQAAQMLNFTPVHKQMLGLSMVATAREYHDPDPPRPPTWNPAWWAGWGGPWA